MGTLTIESGETESPNLRETVALEFVRGYTFIAPETLTGTVKVETSYKRDPTADDWTTVMLAGVDFVIPAGKTVMLPDLMCKSLRLVSSAAEAADRGIGVIGHTSLPG